MAKFSDNSMADIVWDFLTMMPGALASGDFVIAASRIDTARIQGFRILKTEWYVSMRNATTGEGGFLLGMCHDLTAAELASMVDADPQRPKDTAASE